MSLTRSSVLFNKPPFNTLYRILGKRTARTDIAKLFEKRVLAQNAVDVTLAAIQTALKNGDAITLAGIGTFDVKKSPNS